MAWMRSRGRALPRLRCSSAAFSLPPAWTTAKRWFSSAISPSWCLCLVSKEPSCLGAGTRKLALEGPEHGDTPSCGPYHTEMGSTPPDRLVNMAWRLSACPASCTAMLLPPSTTKASSTMSSWPDLTVSLASTDTDFTVPSKGAWISVSNFMADTSTKTSPFFTSVPTPATTCTTVASMGEGIESTSCLVTTLAFGAEASWEPVAAPVVECSAAPCLTMKDILTSLFTNSGCNNMFLCRCLFVLTPSKWKRSKAPNVFSRAAWKDASVPSPGAKQMSLPTSGS
mmetsp:Transcript_165444/g.530878  ORF Transcript_165444/g.530878 Transcript_165444/m.530878 type:complete len:283 (-) Transcript_165444:1321-2169(-)